MRNLSQEMLSRLERYPALPKRTPREKGTSKDSHACPMTHRMASCLLLHHTHAHTFPCPCFHQDARYTSWAWAISLHSGHVPYTEQREATEGPAEHNLLSLQGQPKSFTISSNPRRGWRRQHGVGRQPWTWSQKAWL